MARYYHQFSAQETITDYIGAYAFWAIREAYRVEHGAEIRTEFSVGLADVCYYQRQQEMARRAIQSAGLCHSWNLSDPSVEKILEVAPQYWSEPTFSGGDTLPKERTTKDRYAAYRRVDGLTKAQAIYVWRHLDEYDFVMITENIHTSGGYRYSAYGTVRTNEVLSLYPKARLQTAETEIYWSKLKAYADSHLGTCLGLMTGHKYPMLDAKNSLQHQSDPFISLNLDLIPEAIIKAQDMIMHLTTGIQELTALGEQIEIAGGGAAYKEKMYQALYEYLRRMFPVHMVPTEEDEELQELALLTMKGQDRGVLQECEPVVDIRY